MIVTPVLPIGILVIVALLLTGFAVWRLIAARGTKTALDWSLRIVMVLLVLVIGIRPAIAGSGTGPKAVGGLEVYFVVDTTSSMAAEDWSGNNPRLDGVRSDIADIAGGLSGAQFSLVTFDSTTIQRVPLTSDATALRSAAATVTQEATSTSTGSSISEPVSFMTTLLKEAQKQHPEHKRVIFYLGDGEQTVAGAPGSFAALAPFVSGGQVLGYGTSTGGRMKVYSGYDPNDVSRFADGSATPPPGSDDGGYIQDPTADPPGDAISKIDETTLKTIAEQLKVGYLHRTATTSVAAATAGITVGATTVEPGNLRGPIELYWIFAIPLALLALRELGITLDAILKLRPRREPTPEGTSQ